MATSEQKRQKKLAKKRSKEIAKRKQLAAEKNAMRSIGGQLAAASQGKFHQCYIYDALLDDDNNIGIGAVIASRFLPDGNFVFACFLIDRYCLGVKDTYAADGISTPIIGAHAAPARTQPDPAVHSRNGEEVCHRIRSLGGTIWTGAHPDYNTINKIWPDVDATQSDHEFVFGKDGKPLFIQGPHDSPARVKQVMQALSARAGDGNYDFTIAAPAGMNAFDPMDMAALEQGEEIRLDDGDSSIRIDPAE